MEAGIFVAWNWQMIIVLVVTLLQNWLAGRSQGRHFLMKQIYLDVRLRGSWSHATVEGLCNHLPPTKCRICCQTAFYCHPIQRPAIVAPDRFLAQEKHVPLNGLNRLQNVKQMWSSFLAPSLLGLQSKGGSLWRCGCDPNWSKPCLLHFDTLLATLQKEFDRSFRKSERLQSGFPWARRCLANWLVNRLGNTVATYARKSQRDRLSGKCKSWESDLEH